MPALVRFECLGPFFNTLAADDKYSRRNMMNLQATTSNGIISKTKDFFCNFYCFYETYIKFRTFWSKNVSFIVSVFPKLLTPKEVVTGTSKTPCFRTPFGNQRVREFQTLSKSARHHYYFIVPWIWDKLSWKKCRLVRFEILELFVNTLTTMTSIPVAISRIWPNNFKRLCLKNKRLSIEFLLHISNLEQVQTILSKKMSLLA